MRNFSSALGEDNVAFYDVVHDVISSWRDAGRERVAVGVEFFVRKLRRIDVEAGVVEPSTLASAELGIAQLECASFPPRHVDTGRPCPSHRTIGRRSDDGDLQVPTVVL